MDSAHFDSEQALRQIYAQPAKAVQDKAFAHLDRHSRHFLALSPFFCIRSSRPDGLGDVSPRGGERGFVPEGKRPQSVIHITIREVYFHSSKALRRSGLWNPDKRLPKGSFPTLGRIARDQFKLLMPVKVIHFALDQDAKRNLY